MVKDERKTKEVKSTEKPKSLPGLFLEVVKSENIYKGFIGSHKYAVLPNLFFKSLHHVSDHQQATAY